MSDHFRRFGLPIFLVITLCGCGDGLSSLTGTVTIDGKPAPEGLSLTFQPLESGSPSYATVDRDGAYEAQFTFKRSGIQAGKHRVHLIPSEVSRPMPVIGDDGKPIADESSDAVDRFSNLPEDYYREIEIITIEPGANTKDIKLSTAVAEQEVETE